MNFLFTAASFITAESDVKFNLKKGVIYLRGLICARLPEYEDLVPLNPGQNNSCARHHTSSSTPANLHVTVPHAT